MILKKISIFIDNYVWILCHISKDCIIIDPGLSEPIIQEIKKHNLYPVAIFLTHDHLDHTGGVENIIKYYPNIIVFGPNEIKNNYVNIIVNQGDKINILNQTFNVFFTPGHTLGHVSYYSKPYLFCGDTLFSGGCGRVYKNKYLDMYRSIEIIKSLPDNTMLCCAHEYTLSNLNFSMSILKNDIFIKLYFEKIKKHMKNKKSSLPSYMIFEKKINLFLRTKENILKSSMGLSNNASSLEVFKELRLKKDSFWS